MNCLELVLVKRALQRIKEREIEIREKADFHLADFHLVLESGA